MSVVIHAYTPSQEEKHTLSVQGTHMYTVHWCECKRALHMIQVKTENCLFTYYYVMRILPTIQYFHMSHLQA